MLIPWFLGEYPSKRTPLFDSCFSTSTTFDNGTDRHSAFTVLAMCSAALETRLTPFTHVTTSLRRSQVGIVVKLCNGRGGSLSSADAT
jgi:hypothetical protein